MNNKRKVTWDRLREQMGNKRTATTARATKGSSAPHELIVQRLASEPDNKQTFKPVQPREFVNFPYEEFTMVNLKKACASHFDLPATACDVLVSNKGPSATNMNQIPHRKDKVYLVRFVVGQENSSITTLSSVNLNNPTTKTTTQSDSPRSLQSTSSLFSRGDEKLEKTFPASVSIATLLNAGKLVKPKDKNKQTLTFEAFDVANQKWTNDFEEVGYVETSKFSSGGFRDAYHATLSMRENQENHWVVKFYNSNAMEAITEVMQSNAEDHCRKQVQMHSVAMHIVQRFQNHTPPEFGECFSFNRCFFTKVNGQPATIEEFIPGSFSKLINNNGKITLSQDDLDDRVKELLLKAECLVHYSYESSGKKFMLLDVQGMGYKLFDPEIATTEVQDEVSKEVLFCCGNCSTVGIDAFIAVHKCNKFCKMMGLRDNLFYEEA